MPGLSASALGLRGLRRVEVERSERATRQFSLRGRATSSIFVTIVAALALSASASAHFDNTGQYTHKGCPGTADNRIDPINIVFYTWGTWDRDARGLEYHAGWFDQGGSDQYFVDHGSCYLRHTQRASAGVSSPRFHIRLRGQHSDTTVRGAPAAFLENGERLEIQTGVTTIVIFARGRDEAIRIANGLQGLNVNLAARAPLPPPAKGAVDGTLRCS